MTDWEMDIILEECIEEGEHHDDVVSDQVRFCLWEQYVAGTISLRDAIVEYREWYTTLTSYNYISEADRIRTDEELWNCQGDFGRQLEIMKEAIIHNTKEKTL